LKLVPLTCLNVHHCLNFKHHNKDLQMNATGTTLQEKHVEEKQINKLV